MKKFFTIFLLSILSLGISNAQTLLFNENFDYTAGALLNANGYSVNSGTTNLVTVTSPGLTFNSYPSVSGNAVTLTTSGEDVYKSFTSATPASVYLAFLMKVQSAQTGDYFIALSPAAVQYNYFARVHIKASGTGYAIGISKSNEVTGGASYGTTVLAFNTTYLFVVKHTFVSGDLNDSERIFVFSSTIPTTEPTTSEVGPYVETTKTDPTDVGYITLRQGGATYAPALILDGIRISDNWGLAVTGTATGVEEKPTAIIPTDFQLAQNYPNPFNPSTVISYQLPAAGHVSLKVYDVLGNEVATLVNEFQQAGNYNSTFNTNSAKLSSGVYFYKLQSGSFVQTKKMILMK